MFKILDFISYWYMRYLFVTELYLVEKWERHMIHVLILVLFIGFWYINNICIQFVTNCIT